MEQKQIQPKQDSGKKALVIILSVIGALVFLSLIAGAAFGWKKYSQKKKEMQALEQQVKTLKQGLENTAPSGTGTATVSDSASADDEYFSWNTYTNKEIGYSFRYPADWILKETDHFDTFRDMTSKYVTIESPERKYWLHWGLKGANDSFAITDRTGVGTGDFVDAGIITILRTATPVQRLVWQGKTKEYFYTDPEMGNVLTSDGDYEFLATFSYGDGTDWNLADITDVPEKVLAEKILRSVTIIGKTISSSGCTSTLTNSEKTEIASWKNFKNSKHGYFFKYPGDWKIESSQDDYAELRGSDGGEEMAFRFRSDTMTATDYMGFQEDSQKNTLIACQPASIMYLSGDPTSDPAGDPNSRLILTQFEKDGIPHLVTFFYSYIGASLSSDYVEAYGLILKSIEFSK